MLNKITWFMIYNTIIADSFCALDSFNRSWLFFLCDFRIFPWYWQDLMYRPLDYYLVVEQGNSPCLKWINLTKSFSSRYKTHYWHRSYYMFFCPLLCRSLLRWNFCFHTVTDVNTFTDDFYNIFFTWQQETC